MKKEKKNKHTERARTRARTRIKVSYMKENEEEKRSEQVESRILFTAHLTTTIRWKAKILGFDRHGAKLKYAKKEEAPKKTTTEN